eukprot:gene9987-12241_t
MTTNNNNNNNNVNKRKFLEMEAPAGYIAGISRGAVGFTTRSDIGSARGSDVPGFPQSAQQQKELLLKSRALQQQQQGKEDDDDDYVGGNNFDEFEGDGETFTDANAVYDQEDKEADDIWEQIDKKMDSRRKTRREAIEKEEIEKFRVIRPKIQQQMSDLKQELSKMTEDEWSMIPDAGDFSRKNVKRRADIYVPVPDSLIERAKQENETYSILSTAGGTETSATDLTQVGSARKTVLDLKLHQVSDSVSGQTCVDPKGYLTDLKSKRIATDSEIGDIKKLRLLCKSIIQTTPKLPKGWIAAAKLEVLAGKISDARKLIVQGCKECPDSEEMWIENANLQSPEGAKIVLAQAVKLIPHSVKIWLYAANLEKELKMKRRVLRRALEFIPSSVKLWKEAVELEEPEDARIMLGRAVECVPDNVELWLALSNLETYERAREVLNRARSSVPSSPEIWIAAAQLEESANHPSNVNKIIKKAIKSLSSNIMVMDREKWIKEAEKSEKSDYILTCQAIIFETIGMGVEQDERKRIWCLDAEECITRGSIKTASAIYAHTLTVYPGKKSIWLKVAHLEKTYGTRESLEQTLQKAIKYCPQCEILWLMYAKEKWIGAGDVIEARKILTRAFESNPGSEDIWLAAVKIESEMNEIKVARGLLQRARETAPTERIWMKSAMLEREYGESAAEQTLLEQGITKFPQSHKLWLMRVQLEERKCVAGKSTTDAIRQTYGQALKKCPHCVPLWIEYARFEQKQGAIHKARAQLELAILKNPRQEDLYLSIVRFENATGNQKMASTQLSKGIQECPLSGKLWAESIAMEPRHSQKNKCVDALNKCNNDPFVFTQVARVFWADGKIQQAKRWFNRAIVSFPDHGDAWAYYYAFTLKTSTNPETESDEIIKKCLEAEPHHGEEWIKISKAIVLILSVLNVSNAFSASSIYNQTVDLGSIVKGKLITKSFTNIALPATSFSIHAIQVQLINKTSNGAFEKDNIIVSSIDFLSGTKKLVSFTASNVLTPVQFPAPYAISVSGPLDLNVALLTTNKIAQDVELRYFMKYSTDVTTVSLTRTATSVLSNFSSFTVPKGSGGYTISNPIAWQMNCESMSFMPAVSPGIISIAFQSSSGTVVCKSTPVYSGNTLVSMTPCNSVVSLTKGTTYVTVATYDNSIERKGVFGNFGVYIGFKTPSTTATTHTTASTGPSATTHTATGPSSSGPSSSGPSSTTGGHSSTGPSTSGGHASGPSSAGGHASGPSSAGGHSSGPSSAGGHSSGPSSSGPSSSSSGQTSGSQTGSQSGDQTGSQTGSQSGQSTGFTTSGGPGTSGQDTAGPTSSSATSSSPTTGYTISSGMMNNNIWEKKGVKIY